METTEVKLSKHLSAAVNAIQKEIDKKEKQALRFKAKSIVAENKAELLEESISGLKEQISKLKGE